MTVHLKSTNPMWSLKRATRMLNTKFKILHTTIQVEEDKEKGCKTEDLEDDSDSETYQCNLYH